MRIISADAQEALDSGRFTVRCLLSVHMDDPEDVFAIWDDVGDIVVDDVVYKGAAGRFTIQTSVSVKDLSIQNLDVTLSGLDSEVASLIDGAEWHQRPIVVTRAIIATETPTVLHLMPEFSGFLDQMFWKETPGGTSEMRFRAESASREFSLAGARTRSSSDQRQRDSDDGFFDFAASAITTQIDWGRTPEVPGQKKSKPGGIAGLIDRWF